MDTHTHTHARAILNNVKVGFLLCEKITSYTCVVKKVQEDILT